MYFIELKENGKCSQMVSTTSATTTPIMNDKDSSSMDNISVEENGPSSKRSKLLEDYDTQILANHAGTPRKYHQTLLDRPSSLIQPVSMFFPE